ncbi:hypothetical protein GCM10009839_67460 [Catenulispora yoronensis]|uniref:Uncharacterized protein n=1 Tax=Catenulispora yoronensis TaxID=450799 RepID=A0ABN2V5H4_9ACTN
MTGPDSVPPTWEQAMWQAAQWLGKMEKDSHRKIGDVHDMIRADADAARAWIAYATEVGSRSRGGSLGGSGGRGVEPGRG